MTATNLGRLFDQHRRLAEKVAWRFFELPGADRDDIEQEADIALWEACSAWDPKKGPLEPFAQLVISRRLTDKLRTAKARKHGLLTGALRVSHVNDEGAVAEAGSETSIAALLPSHAPALDSDHAERSGDW